MFDMRLLNFMVTVAVNVFDPFKIIRNYFVKPLVSSANRIYEDYKAKAFDTLDGSQSLVLRAFVILSVGFLLFCGAVLAYVLFYLMYMPAATILKPVHMQYNKICDDEKTCDLKSMTSPYHSFPIAHLQLQRNQLMMVNQPYHINLRLEVPETPRNQDLGIFMVCIDMKDKENSLKSHACRSTMLRYNSPLLTKIKTLLFLPFYIFNLREEKQDLDIEMFSKYIDSTNSVTDIYVEIQSKVVEFYTVTLHINAHFTGLRYLIFNFPTISAAIGIAVNFFVLVITTILLWYHYDYEMEWVEEARRKYTGKVSPKFDSRKVSSSISTTDENLSMLEYNDRLADEDFLFDSDDGVKKTLLEE
jgi:seipin